ncbi:MAG: serine/threonine protein kinase [Chloroflexi bacterium]|nr:serine/threonine protein kinase [Chloroflexota bacterium]
MTKIGRYEIVDELGEGATATVYLARDPYMKRQVAVKVLSYGRVEDPLFKHLFQQEAEAIAALDHPAIAQVYDFGIVGVQPYIVTRYLRGGTLMEQIKERPLPMPELRPMMNRVAGALDEAHRQHIIHRDVKPSNILYDQEGEAYLADFGLSKFARRASKATKDLFMGTPHFMSPEHICGEKIDGRTDVYALGVVLFMCLTQQLPYSYKNPMDVARAHMKEPIPRVQEKKPELPPMWDEIMQKALAKDREARYQTAGVLAADVELAVTRRWHLHALS